MSSGTTVDQHTSADSRKTEALYALQIHDLVIQNRRDRQLVLRGEKSVDVRIAFDPAAFQAMNRRQSAPSTAWFRIIVDGNTCGLPPAEARSSV